MVLVITEGQQCDRIKSGSQITTQLCAGSIDSKISRDTCQGDRYVLIIKNSLKSMNFSGGPLMIQTSDDRWEIIGVTSYGKGCGRLNELGVYTRISMYKNWIDATINNLDDDSSRMYNRLDNIFFNSACHFSMHIFLLFYFLVIGINNLIH